MPNKRVVITTSGDVITGPAPLDTKMFTDVENIFMVNTTSADAYFQLYLVDVEADVSGSFYDLDDSVGGNVILPNFGVSATNTAFNDFGKMLLNNKQVLVAKALVNDTITANVFYRYMVDHQTTANYQ